MKTKIHYIRYLLLQALLLLTITFGMTQTSFEPGEGCLNIIDISSMQGLGEYGNQCISAKYLHEIFINERFSME